MASSKPRKNKKKSLSRSEIVTVRLDPRLRYLASLAARKQRRTLSSYIEWVVEKSLDTVYLKEQPNSPSIANDALGLWHTEEAARFINLAIKYPELLTHDEQLLRNLLVECDSLWKDGKRDGANLILERLLEGWEVFKKVASGELDRSKLPEWFCKK